MIHYLYGGYFSRAYQSIIASHRLFVIGLTTLIMLLSSQAAALTVASYTAKRSSPTDATTNVDRVIFQIDFLAGARVFDLERSDINVTFTTFEAGTATVESVIPSLDSNRYLVTLLTTSSGSLSISLQPTTIDNAGENYQLSPALASEIYTIDKNPPNPPSLTVSPLWSTDPTPMVSGTADPDSTVIVSSTGGQGCSVAVAADGSWNCEVNPALPFGTQLLNVQAKDLAGNTSVAIPVTLEIIDANGDDDSDSIPNADELPRGDSDRDGLPDYKDADDDNDSVLTLDELPGDSDADGIPDYLEPNNLDTDGDGLANVNDPDDDGDGKTTNTEIITTPSLAFIDVDKDGIADHLDKDDTNAGNTSDSSGDSDSNGISDLVECPDRAGTSCPDMDHDGIPDYTDTDNDNDGISDINEIGSNSAAPIDTDGDAIPDYYEPNHRDTDGDSLKNHEDADDDGDNLPTLAENPLFNDVDNDGIPDYLDPDTNAITPTGNDNGDADRDGISDRQECPLGPICPDSDNDAIPDYMDADSLASTPANPAAVDTVLKGGAGSINLFFLLAIGVIAITRRYSGTRYALLLPGILLASSSPLLLHAANTLDKQWYVGGALGQSKLSPDGHGVWNTTENNGTALKLYAGMDINSSFSLEGFWNDFGEAEIHNGASRDNIQYSAYGANMVYRAPVVINRLHPFGKLGIARIKTSSNGTATINQVNNYTIFAGLGAEYALNSSLTVRGEYEYFDKDIRQLSVGINWAPQGRAHYNTGSTIHPNTAALPAALPIKAIPQAQPSPVSITPRRSSTYRTLNRTLSGGSNFASGSAQLNTAGMAALTHLVQDIRQSRLTLNSIHIVGHTDNVGNAHNNLLLSQQRANTVANFLVSQGIDRRRIKTSGLGEKQPVSTNSTPWGRAKNRRVEITIQGMETVVYPNP